MSGDDFGWLVTNAGNLHWNTTTLIRHLQYQREQQYAAAIRSQPQGSPGILIGIPAGELLHTGDRPAAVVSPLPEILVGALVERGDTTDQGDIIVAVTPIYRRFLRELERDPNAFRHLDWRQGEELVAGGYEEEEWKVILTPRSGDGGRDIIATRPDFGTIRIIDQVKFYAPDHVVDADEVRSLWGVLTSASEIGTSKAIITTSSRFAPGVYTEFKDRVPGRLNLRDGKELREWLLVDRPR